MTESVSPSLARYRKYADEINARRRKLYAEDEWYRNREKNRKKKTYLQKRQQIEDLKLTANKLGYELKKITKGRMNSGHQTKYNGRTEQTERFWVYDYYVQRQTPSAKRTKELC